MKSCTMEFRYEPRRPSGRHTPCLQRCRDCSVLLVCDLQLHAQLTQLLAALRARRRVLMLQVGDFRVVCLLQSCNLCVKLG